MIIKPFNAVWFVFMTLIALVVVVLTKAFSNKSRSKKLLFIKYLAIFSTVFWVLYKYWLFKDVAYTKFDFWNELPLQPCNTALWLAIVACVFDSKNLMKYIFYCGVGFAVMALTMAEPEFMNNSIFMLRNIGYWGTHALVIIIGCLFATLNLFEINVKSAHMAVLMYALIALFMHGVNILLRHWGLNPKATYYYTFGKDDNFILDIVHSKVGINYLYLYVLSIPAVTVFVVETWIINLFKKKK